MRVEFRQGVPRECIVWLWEHVGNGNLSRYAPDQLVGSYQPTATDAWHYERVALPIIPRAFGDDPFEYVPTITVKDPKKATLFALRWSSNADDRT